MIKLFVGSDHGGFNLKEKIEYRYDVENVDSDSPKVEVVDVGPEELDPNDDYPKYAFNLGETLRRAQNANDRDINEYLGILICRSGNGMVIAANKVPGIRAALCFNVEHAKKAREHDHANVLVLDADYLNEEEHFQIIHAFLHAEPSQEERHVRRVGQISDYENSSKK